MLIWKHTPRKRILSLMAQSLKNLKVSCSSSTRHFMVSNQVVKRWAEGFFDIIKDMGFRPSKPDPCIWMRENKNLKCSEYLATSVDDLCIAAQDRGKIIQTLKENYKLKVKGDGLLSHHLGAHYTMDKDKTLVCQPKKYIDRLIESCHSAIFPT